MNYLYLIEKRCIITLAPEKEIGFSAYTIPARFQDYLFNGKPIIASIDGETKEIIKKIKCGLVSDAGDVEGLCNNIVDFIENKEKYIINNKEAINYYNQEFSKSVIMNEIEKTLYNLV